MNSHATPSAATAPRILIRARARADRSDREGGLGKVDRALAIVCALVATVSCGELQPPELSRALVVTVSRDACTSDGFGALIPERFRATFVNGTSGHAAFNLARLNDGSSYQELAAYVGEQQRLMQIGEPEPGTAPFVTIFIQRALAPLDRSDIDTVLPRGTYGIVCARGTASRREAIFVIGPYVVP